MAKYRKINKEIFYAKGPVIKVSRRDIEKISKAAFLNPKKRARLCTHADINDPLHEMLIGLTAGTYIRPHKHINKTESFHVISGRLKVIVFNDTGKIKEVIEMSGFPSGKNFYYRLAQGIFHTVVPVSKIAVFHETTNGPFDRDSTVFAPWSPSDGDAEACKKYIRTLKE